MEGGIGIAAVKAEKEWHKEYRSLHPSHLALVAGVAGGVEARTLLTLHLSQALASPRGPERDASVRRRTASMASRKGARAGVHAWGRRAQADAADLRAPMAHGPRTSQALSRWATSGRKREPARVGKCYCSDTA